MATRPVCPATALSATTVCVPGHGPTATAVPGNMSCSIPTSPHSTAIARSTATISHSATPLASPTSNGACTRNNTNNSCRLASPALAAIPISCDGAAIPPCRPLSKRSFAVCSSKLARPTTSTSTLSRNELAGMTTKPRPFGISTSA